MICKSSRISSGRPAKWAQKDELCHLKNGREGENSVFLGHGIVGGDA